MSQCVRSGLCCKSAPCPYGEWDIEKHQCKFLEIEKTGKNYEFYKCGKYEEIIKHRDSWISPAFGAGCCMSLFNTARNKNITAINDGTANLSSINSSSNA